MPEENSSMNDPLSGLLGALLGGHPAVQDQIQNTGQSLDQVLAGLPNATSSDGKPASSSFGDLLGSLMGGSPQTENTSSAATGGDALSSILGGLLGGGMSQGGTPMPGQPMSGSDPMSSILNGLLGGGMQGATSNASVLGNNSFLAPIVDAIATKIGIPPQIAQAVVSFALTQLMSGQGDSQLAQMLGGTGNVSQKYLRDSGLVNELAQQTGLDTKTATKSLQQALQAFGTQMGEGTTDEHQQGLQSWLESR
ncbi:MAG: hypothetical protein HZB51_13180 [Chloroflexi bacterium]|nr:hypothetical protein [Chloroflexota bacterium]